MYKSFFCMLFAVTLICSLVIPAQAVQYGRICIAPQRVGEKITGGSVTISRVGTTSEDGYLITGKTANWLIAADEVFLPETATWVRKHARGEKTTKRADASGMFLFCNVEAGLYLVTQSEPESGYAPFQPFLLELPVGGKMWEAEAFPKVEKIQTENPKTGDHPAPIVSAMMLVLSFSALLLLSDKRKK